MPAAAAAARFTLVTSRKVFVTGGPDATIVDHEYQDGSEVLKDLDKFGMFADCRDKVQVWLDQAKSGQKFKLQRGYVVILLLCHRTVIHQRTRKPAVDTHHNLVAS